MYTWSMATFACNVYRTRGEARLVLYTWNWTSCAHVSGVYTHRGDHRLEFNIYGAWRLSPI